MGSRSKSPRFRHQKPRGALLHWLRGVASPESILLVLIVWFMLALSLHVLLADILMEQGGEPSSLKSREMSALQALRRRVTGTHRKRNHHLDHKFDPSSSGGDRPRKKKKGGHTTYLTKRQQFEEKYPPMDIQRIRDFVASLRDADLDAKIAQIASKDVLPYDPMDCPESPPHAYPIHYSLINLLEEWPVDDLQWPTEETDDSHPYLFHTICVFDWDRPEHQERAKAYQVEYDVPFIVRNNPEFLGTAERWMRDNPSYLRGLIDEDPQRTEHSANNHLPFWRLPGKKTTTHDGWVPPTENVQMTFDEWYEKAISMEQAIAQGQDHTKMDHWYFRLNGETHHNNYLYEELPLFDPGLYDEGENIFMWEPENARGVNCRWGMAGNIAEAHYDSGRNWIILLGGGQRRYILAHPQECPNLALYPIPHPSSRHSKANWSEIGKLASSGEAKRELADAQAFQVVLQASDALFLPTHWFHFIVSLNRNYQCNARSGRSDTYSQYIEDCGFPS